MAEAADQDGDGASLAELDREGDPPIRAASPRPPIATATVWGLPLAVLTRAQAADAVMDLIDAGRPSYFITANLHYAMLTSEVPRLKAINAAAALVLADGAPVVWASRWQDTPVPERVAGSDLIYDLCERAAARGDRLFLLGGAEGVAVEAANRLQARYPGLVIAGTACPSPEELAGEALLDVIRRAKPDLLLVALGQPKGEFWIADHGEALGVPVSVQVGATLDFLAGRVKRAPRWIQKIGMEWSYRMWLEPARLAPRYARNAWFLIRQVLKAITRKG